MKILHAIWKYTSYLFLIVAAIGFIAFCWEFPFTLFLLWAVATITYFVQLDDEGGI